MLIALLIAGIVFLLAGLLGVAFGIPVKEFSFGNTEILAGVITACAGAIMLALWVAVRELKRAMQPLGSGVGPDLDAAPARAVFPQPAANPAPHEPASGHDDLMFNQPGAIRPDDAEPAASPPPWHEETASRDRGRNETPPALPGPAAEPAPKQRRNLLFSSTSRKERERAEARTGDPALPDPHPAAPAAPPLPKPSETPPATFEDAWPQSERPRSVDVSRRSRTPPLPSPEGNAAGTDHPSGVRNEEPPQVTVLKSGVVDGMAYSLYSDGSIEAQMPEGMMRFASIDELRTHLDQRT
jgi:hypothetical protein